MTSAPASDLGAAIRGEHDMLSSLEVARRLLADEAVRSVTIDPDSGHATLRYRDRRVDHAPLSGIQVEEALDAIAGDDAAIECWPDQATGSASYVRAPQQATGWRRWMHLALAAVWFSLAVLGAILPGLPCTCFLLLTSYSLCRSSQRLHKRLLDSRWFGPTLRHWRVHRGVRPGVKAKALGTLVVMVGLSLAFAPLPAAAWWAVAGASAIGAGCIVRLRVVSA